MTTKFFPHYDLIVIGSGPAGQRAAVQAAKIEKKVLVIEKEKIGGSCVHLGTIPSKTMREAAILGDKVKNGSLLPVMKRKNDVIANETKIIRNQLERNGVHFAEGSASFLSPHEIEIRNGKKTQTVKGEKIFIAVGTTPSQSTDYVFDHTSIFDSDSILALKKAPKSILIVGAGVIGCEYASIFAKLGVKVTLVDRRKELLRSVDDEIVEHLKAQFALSKIALHLGSEMSPLVKNKKTKQLEITIDKKKKKIEAALICLGREGNTKSLGLEKVGILAEPRGLLKVNAQYQTTASHIYAVGDVIGAPALAASSSEQGRLAACYAFGVECDPFPDSFPYGIYTIPEISTVGLHERDLLEKKIPYVVGRAKYKELARGQILQDESGFLKLLFHKETHVLLGIHIIGSGATELVHIGQVAFAHQAKVEFFLKNVFNYPTLAEAYKVAAYNAMNHILGQKSSS